MKAPDKIYLQEGVKAPFETWTYREFPAYKNIEYIRKDAMLDWLKEQKIKSEKNWNCSNDDGDQGMIYAYQKVIEKIESL